MKPETLIFQSNSAIENARIILQSLEDELNTIETITKPEKMEIRKQGILKARELLADAFSLLNKIKTPIPCIDCGYKREFVKETIKPMCACDCGCGEEVERRGDRCDSCHGVHE